MKKISVFCLLSLLLVPCSLLKAQNEYMPISVVVEPLVEPFPETAQVQVTNQLTQLLTKNGIASVSDNCQFVLTVFMVPQDKDVVPGPPMQIVETMDANLYIADVVNQTVFATTTQTLKGVGRSETRAYMDALKRLNTNSKAMTEFVEEGKRKVIAYYDSEMPKIIQRAMVLSDMHQYDEALYLVMFVPSQCKHYNEALAAGLSIFKAQQDYTCVQNLQKARMAWAAEQNAEGARKAGEFLGLIYPDAACYGEAMEVYNEVKAKVLDDWHFEMKKYQDGVDLEKQRIEAARAIGVAYGSHQQPTTTNIGFLR